MTSRHERRECRRGHPELADRAQYFTAITEQDVQSFQVLTREIGNDAEINSIFDKTLRVLGHAELFEPVRNLLHLGQQRSRRGPSNFLITAAESLHRQILDSTSRLKSAREPDGPPGGGHGIPDAATCRFRDGGFHTSSQCCRMESFAAN